MKAVFCTYTLLAIAAFASADRDYVMRVFDQETSVEINNVGNASVGGKVYGPDFSVVGTDYGSWLNDSLWMTTPYSEEGYSRPAIRNAATGELRVLPGSIPFRASHTSALNNLNQVVGLLGGTTVSELVQWDADGSYRVIGPSISVLGFGDNGNIFARRSNDWFILKADGRSLQLPSIFAFHGMNDRGDVFGYNGTLKKSGYWDGDLNFTQFDQWNHPTLDLLTEGFNDNVDVLLKEVGVGGDTFVWNAATGHVRVNVLNPSYEYGRHYQVTGISNNGWITGRVADYNGPTTLRGFVLMPVPEPASFVALAACAGLLIRGRRASKRQAKL